MPCAAPPADFAPFPEWPNVPAEEDESSLFDRKLKPLRLGPGVYARGMQTLITGAEILTSVSGGARYAHVVVLILSHASLDSTLMLVAYGSASNDFKGRAYYGGKDPRRDLCKRV